MASGSFYGVASNASVQVRIDWSSTENVAGNTSLVSATLYLYKNVPYASRTYGTGDWYLAIGASQAHARTAVNLYNAAGWVPVVSHSATVAHAADGTGAVSISGAGGISGTTLSALSCQRSVALDTIPRASALTLETDAVDCGAPLGFTVTPADSSFTHQALVSLGAFSQTIDLQGGTQGTCAVPLSWLSEIPNAQSGQATLTLETYSGQTRVGSVQQSFTVRIPSFVVPALSHVTADVKDGAFGLFVQNKSRCVLSFCDAQGAYGSTISAYVVESVATSTQPQIETPLLTAAGQITYRCYVVDSRGMQSAPVSCTIDVEAYQKPQLSATAHRCDADGTPNVDGTYLLVQATFSASSVGGNNTAQASAAFRRSTDASFGGETPLQSGIASIIGGGTIDQAQSFTVRVTVTDLLEGETTYTLFVAPSFRLMNANAALGGVAFGRMSSKAALQSALDAEFEGDAAVLGALQVGGGTTLSGTLDVTGNAAFAAQLTAQSASLTTPLAIPSGGTGADAADKARANLLVLARPKLLWQGSAGNGAHISTPGIQDYRLILLGINIYNEFGTPVLAFIRDDMGISAAAGSGMVWENSVLYNRYSSFKGSIAADTLGIECLPSSYITSIGNAQSETGASQGAALSYVYGIVLKSELQV